MFPSLRTRYAPVLQSLRKTHTGHVDRRSLPLRDGHVHTEVELAPNVNSLPWSEAPRSVYRHAEVFQKILMACWNYEAVCLPPRMALTDPLHFVQVFVAEVEDDALPRGARVNALLRETYSSSGRLT